MIKKLNKDNVYIALGLGIGNAIYQGLFLPPEQHDIIKPFALIIIGFIITSLIRYLTTLPSKRPRS